MVRTALLVAALLLPSSMGALLLAAPAGAFNGQEAPLREATIYNVSVPPSCTQPTLPVTVLADETAVIDLVCAALTVTVSGNQVLASLSSVPTDGPVSVQLDGISFKVPDLGSVTPVFFDSPGEVTVIEFVLGEVGGQYAVGSANAWPIEGGTRRLTLMLLGGDVVGKVPQGGYGLGIVAGAAIASTVPAPVVTVTAFRSVGDAPECSDRTDNDSDGLMDFPDDPNCADLNGTSEASPAGAAVCGVGPELVLLTPLLMLAHGRRRRWKRR